MLVRNCMQVLLLQLLLLRGSMRADCMPGGLQHVLPVLSLHEECERVPARLLRPPGSLPWPCHAASL